MAATKNRLFKLGFLSVSSLLLLPTVFGTSFSLRALKTSAGSLGYWSFGLILTGLLLMSNSLNVAILYGSCMLCVGLYCELEDMDLSREWSAFWSLTLMSIFGAAGTSFWMATIGDGWREELTQILQAPLGQILAINPDLELTALDLAYRLPAFAFLLFSFWIFIALRLEKPLLNWLKLPTRQTKPLYSFTANDAVVWVFMLSLLGMFVKHEITWLKVSSENILSATMTIYFFQGLSVVAVGFKKYKVRLVSRALSYLLIIVANQLIGIICMLGLVDYWVEFRSRWNSEKTQKHVKEEVF
jgi:hypothetical protein